VVGGWAHQGGSGTLVFALGAGLALLWLLVAATMAPPRYLATRLLRVAEGRGADEALAIQLRTVAGVVEAVPAPDENLIYLKVDTKLFDTARAEALAGMG
jgi:hypothetical protein